MYRIDVSLQNCNKHCQETSVDAPGNANKENEAGTSGVGSGGDGQQERLAEAEEAYNADNYYARQVRKCTKKKEQVDAFQE